MSPRPRWWRCIHVLNAVRFIFQWHAKDFDQLSDEDEAQELERKFSVEELTKQFTPEVIHV
jgi:hypothetical protein